MSNPTVESSGKNHRNGYSKKTVKTQLGEVARKMPIDRNGEFAPQIISKHSRSADGIVEKACTPKPFAYLGLSARP